jgi:hypothetical protein
MAGEIGAGADLLTGLGAGLSSPFFGAGTVTTPAPAGGGPYYGSGAGEGY